MIPHHSKSTNLVKKNNTLKELSEAILKLNETTKSEALDDPMREPLNTKQHGFASRKKRSEKTKQNKMCRVGTFKPVTKPGAPTTPKSSGSEGPIPLIGALFEVRIVDFCAEVTLKQRFENREESPIEAIYEFVLDPTATVANFFAGLLLLLFLETLYLPFFFSSFFFSFFRY